MRRLSVRYRLPAELIADHDQQMVRGGLLVRGAPPAGLALFEAVEVEISADFAPLDGPEVIRGQVVQMVAGAGVAVAFKPTPRLVEAVAEARALAAPRAPAAGASTADKIHRALHGNKDERAALLRDINKMVHPYVLKNPHLGVDEVLAMAKMRSIAPEVLQQIADRRDWAQRPDIAAALVRNPKTPVPVAVRLLDYVSPLDLRQLAKDGHTRPPIQQAARRKVIG